MRKERDDALIARHLRVSKCEAEAPRPKLRVGLEFEQVTYKGGCRRQTYLVTAAEPYVRKSDGALTWVHEIASRCCVCGAEFSQKAGKFPVRWLIRTCQEHRSRRRGAW
jgi:hypothetical protein